MLEDIPKNLTCAERIIKTRTVKVWITNTHKNDLITLNKGTCLVEIQIVSETDISNWKKSKKQKKYNYPN